MDSNGNPAAQGQRTVQVVAPRNVTKPIIIETDIWANAPVDPSDIIKPPTTKSDEGWRYGEKPYSAFANYNQNRNDSVLVHINQNGVPEWDSATVYNKGALALFTGNLFHSLQAANQNNLSTDTAWWKPGAGGTGAGMLWSAATNYVIGDMVSHGGPPYTYYTALTDNTNKNPTGGLPDWEEYGSDYHNSVAVTYTPVAGTEYPSTGADTLGAVWYVTGLGVTGVTPNTYTFLDPAGNLVGISVRDDDKLTWVAGTTGLETWLWSPFPRIDYERGGVAWLTSVDYIIGDVVTYLDDVYVCTVAVTGAFETPADPLFWKKGSSSTFDPATGYDEGETVSVGDDIYIAPPGGVPAGVIPPDAPWLKATRGGQLWAANINYLLGDVATWDDISYVAIQDTIGGQPDISTADWQRAGGSTTYDATTIYNEGDIVTQGDQVYIAPAGGVGAGITPPTAPWIASGSSDYVNVTGDAMTGALAMGANKITGLAKATANDDAVSADAYAGTTLGGTLKARLVNVAGDWTLYLTNDGSNP